MSIDGYSWWPVASGPGALTGSDLSNLRTFGALANSGGPAYLPSPSNNWPFPGSAFEKFKLVSLEWPTINTFTTRDLDAAAYNEYLQNNDQRLLSKLRMWSFFISSIDSSSEGYNAETATIQNAPNLIGAVSALAQNQGIALVFDNPINMSGLLLEHIITINTLSFALTVGEVSSSEILQAYQDSWENAYQYWRLEAQDEKNSGIWWNKNAIPALFRPFVVIAHSPSGFVTQLKNLNSPIDLLSPKSGFQKTNSGVIWNRVRALEAIGNDFWNMQFENNNFEWFKFGISQGDNFGTIPLDPNERAWYPTTRKWAPEATAGAYSEGYAGTISNGNLDSQVPQIDCLAIVPLFAVYPEVYQCLVQEGPAFDRVNTNTTPITITNNVYSSAITPEQRQRFKNRKYVFTYPVETLTINRMFEQTVTGGKKMAISGAGLPASGLQYVMEVRGSVGAGSAVTIWPSGEINSTYPTHHIKLYNILDRGEGFAHSYALRQSFTATDWGMGLMFGAVMGAADIGAAIGGMAIGEALSPKQVLWLGLRPSLKSINNALMVWNPQTTEQENSTAIHVSDVAIGPNRPSIVPDVDLPNTKGQVITEISSKDGEGLGTWAIWPQSWSESGGLTGTKFISRGLIKIRFRAKTNIPKSIGSTFLEFRFYAVDISQIPGISTFEQLIAGIKGSRKDISLIDSSTIGQYEFLLRLYNNGGIETQGPGREFIWKPLFTSSALAKNTTDPFETIRQSSNDIFSPNLDTQYQDFVMNLFLDDFAAPTDVNPVLANKIESGSNIGLGARILNGESIFLFVNIRVRSIVRSTVTDPIQVSLDLSAMDITFPAKSLQSDLVGLEQRFYNSFNPISGGNTPYNEFKMFLPASLADEINNSVSKIYDFQWKGYPELTKMVQLSPFNSSVEIPKLGLRALGISGGRSGSISDEDWIKILKSREGIYFVTAPYIMDYSLLVGDRDLSWHFDLAIQEIDQPSTGTITNVNNLIAYYSLSFIDEANNVITMKEEGLARGTADSLPIGPLVSDITFLSSGYLLLKIVLAVDSPGLQDNPAIVYISPLGSGLRHDNSIRKIIATGPIGDVKGGKHMAWYRGLTIGNFDFSQEMIYVMDSSTETGWVLPDGNFNFFGVVRSPTIKVKMARPYGWVLEYDGLGFTSPRAAMIKDTGRVDSQKLSLSMTTNDGNALDLMASDNLTSNISLFKLSTNSALLDTINMNIDGEDIQGKETAIAQSSRGASNSDGKQTSKGIIVGIGSKDDDGEYIRTAAYTSGLFPSEENI